MRRIVVAAIGFTLIVASFTAGRFTERHAQGRSNIRPADPKSSDQVLIANVASVSFGESWDLIRRTAREKRLAWARELEQLPPGTRRNAAIESFYKVWVELDPTAAVRAVETIRDKQLQSLAFFAIAAAAADSALPAVVELERQLGYRPNDFSPLSAFWRWAAVDPQAAAGFIVRHPMTGSARFFDVAYSWATSEPAKVGEWLINLKLSPLHDPKYPRMHDRRRLDAARGLLLGWLHNDSRGAAAFAAAHADDSDVKQALGEFGRALFARSRDEATAFIQSLPNEDAQRATLDELLQDVRGVIRMTEGGDEEEPEEAEVARGEIPPWLVTLPANLWNEHAAEIFECWDAADASRAERWLRTLPSDIRSKAIVDYCASAPIEKAARVFELSAFLNEAEVRNSLLQKFVDNVSRDPSEARNKIAALPLTDQQKHALLSRVRDNR